MRHTWKTWLAGIAILFALLLAWTAAGPYMTIRAIQQAVRAQDAGELAEQVDFPTLRASLKAQMVDEVVRQAGPDVQTNPFGAIALTMATGVVNGLVDGMVNPAGLSAVMQGQRLWKNSRESFERPPLDAQGEPLPAAKERLPLEDATMRYESTSRFTATIRDERGQPVVFVLKRDGVRWRLADIRLPLGAAAAPAVR